MASAPTEIRTPVLGLKGLRPSPLDDGGMQAGWILPSPRLGVKALPMGCYGWAGGRFGEIGLGCFGRDGCPVLGFSRVFNHDIA